MPAETRLPLARGVPAVGRTRIFCQVSEQTTPPLLMFVTEKVRFVGVRFVIAMEVPLATPLMFSEFAPLPPTRVTSTFGSGVFVSKINPAGTFRMTFPKPMFALWISV